MINDSITSRQEKIIVTLLITIAFLLLLLAMEVIFIFNKTIYNKASKTNIPNNSLIITGYRSINSFSFMSKIQYIFNIEKSTVVNIKSLENLGDTPDLSPNKRWIVFSRYETSEDNESISNIYIISIDGIQKILVPIARSGTQPVWSPDGKQIAFYNPGWRAEDRAGIYIIDVSCLLKGENCIPEARYLVKQPEGEEKLSSPTWSPNGKQIAYIRAGTVYIINSDRTGQGYTLISNNNNSRQISQIRWSPRGNYIAGICREAPYYSLIANLCIVDINTARITYLTNDDGTGRTKHPKWSPDGEKIAYISNISNKSLDGLCWEGCPSPNSVFTINVDRSENTRLTLSDNEFIQWFFWYP